MKLQQYSLLSDVISAFAIVVSLIFVGVQVNENAAAIRSATANSATDLMMSWYETVGSDAQRSTTYLNGITDPDTLSREEKYQFMMMVHLLMLAQQNAFYLTLEGTLDKEIRDTITKTLIYIKDRPGFYLYWKQRRMVFRPDFADYVDLLLLDNTDTSSYVYKSLPKNPVVIQ